MLLDRAPQVFAVEMGVDFGREDAFVPQHLLHLADRGTAFQQVRRERVAEGVGADALLDSGPSGRLFEDRPPRLFRKTISSPVRALRRSSR